LIVDIDEFWFPKDFCTSISDYLSTKPEYDIISFNWLMQHGDKTPFSMPFSNLVVVPSFQLKSLFSMRVTTNVKRYHSHAPIMVKKVIRLDPNGQTFEEGDKYVRFKNIPNNNSEAFILHRMIRSEIEYLARISKERPGNNLEIKDNRNGFGYKGKLFDINTDKTLIYHKSIQEFINVNCLNEIIQLNRKDVIEKSKKLVNIERTHLIDNLPTYIKVLEGTSLQKTIIEKICNYKISKHELSHIENQAKTIKNKHFCLRLLAQARLSEIKNRLQIKKIEDILEAKNISAADYRNAALATESDDLKTSFKLMKAAHELKPNVPFIIKKLEEYTLRISSINQFID